MSVRALALWAGLVVAGCGSTTEIVLVVDSDLPASRVDTFWIRVSGAGARCFSLPAGEAVLPLTLGLVPSADEQVIEVTAAAFPSGVAVPACERDARVEGAIVLQRARARFVTGERRVLFMTLEAACSGQLCGEVTSCREGRCQSVDRALDPWTGQLPRISTLDAGTMDAGADGGVDAAIVDAGMDGGMDAGRDAGVDAGRDAGRDAGSDAGPCPGAVSAVTLSTLADTQISPRSCSLTTCDGSINYGASRHLNIGQSRVLLRYQLPPALPAGDIATRLLTASVRIRRLRSDAICTSCDNDGDVEARPMRNDWVEGTDTTYTGADWCRRTAVSSGVCGRWGIAGAGAFPEDVAGTSLPVAVPERLDDVRLAIRPEDLAAYAQDDGQVSIQLRARIGGVEGTAVFLVASTEGEEAALGIAPVLELTFCSP